MPRKKKPASRPLWASYSLLSRRPFENDAWLQVWTRFKRELRLKIP